MKLSKEQIVQIDNYLFSCGVKWYDVRIELIDHFANNLEKKLDKTPNLNFKQAIIDEHKNFSDKGFSKLLETKTNEVEKKFYIDSFNYLKSFFKIPKIILSSLFFWSLLKLMTLFENKEDFFLILTGVLLLISIQLLIRLFISKKNKGEKFLVLNRGNNFLQVTNFMMVIFNTISVFRTNNSFENVTHNYIQLFIFVVFVLYYISGEYVYLQLKKKVKSNYPNIKIAN